MIKEDFVKRKISLIQDELNNLERLSHYSFDEIASDPIKQGALERFLERVINRAIDINNHIIAELAGLDTTTPKDYTDSFLELAKLGIYTKEFAESISKSAGTRNVLVHEYDKIDQTRIYNSVADCLRDYHKYCGYILEFLERQSKEK